MIDIIFLNILERGRHAAHGDRIMTNNSKYKKLIIIAAAVAAVVLVVLFATGKLDGILADLTASETYLAEGSDGTSSDSDEGSSSEVSDSGSQSGSDISSVNTSSSSTASSSSKESNNSSGSTSSGSTASSSSKVPSSSSTSDQPSQPQLKFRNKNLLNQHYEKHGIDMGFASAAEYEAAAAKVPYAPNVLHKIEAEDGDDVYYIESTNEFVIVSTDGYLRTYFNPDRGIDYFNRQ